MFDWSIQVIVFVTPIWFIASGDADDGDCDDDDDDVTMMIIITMITMMMITTYC